MPAKTSKPRKRQPPLRNCGSCGRKFRSWSADRYCGRSTCVDQGAYAPSARQDAQPVQLQLGDEPPEPRGVPYNEFPPGF